MTVYNKLIRDRITEIMDQNNVPYEIHIADEQEFITKLHEKLGEEVKEFIETKTKEKAQEEMADLFEVVDTILVLHGWTREQIQEIQRVKREEKGGFTKGIILEWS